MIIQVVGKIGSGKSTISQYIKNNYDFNYIDSDDLVKKMHKTDEFLLWIKNNTKNCILPNGEVDKNNLRSLLFLNPDFNIKLLNFTTPIIRNMIGELIKDKSKNYIIECFSISACIGIDIDHIIIVKSDYYNTLNRIIERDKRSIEETEAIIDFQTSYVEKFIIKTNFHEYFDDIISFVYNNENKIDDSYKQVDSILYGLNCYKISK